MDNLMALTMSRIIRDSDGFSYFHKIYDVKASFDTLAEAIESFKYYVMDFGQYYDV